MTKYFKIGKKALNFYDTITGLSVNTGKPGKLENTTSKKVQEAAALGHIVEIKEDEYKELISQTTSGVKSAVAQSTTNLKASLQKLISQFGLNAVVDAAEEIAGRPATKPNTPKVEAEVEAEEDEEEETEDDAGEDKPLDEMTHAELVDKAHSLGKGSKKNLKKKSDEDLIDMIENT
jgi:hypothetical protein